MSYIYDFDIGTILFFSLTIFFYLYQKRLRNLLDSIFTAMLCCAVTAAVFDFAAVAMEARAMVHPIWLLYGANILFIAAMQTCLPLFVLYALAAAGTYSRFSRGMRLAFLVPYFITMALLLASPFVDFGICRIGEDHIYRGGPNHWVLYCNMGLYVLAGVGVLFFGGKSMEKTRRNVIALFALLLFAAMAVQVRYPQYLVTASATALALTAVFYTLQSPVDQVDPLTGAFSRTLLPALLRDYAERGREYTLLVYALCSFDEFARRYGDDAGDRLLRACAQWLMTLYPHSVVVYMDTSEFIVVHEGILSKAQTRALADKAPKTILVEEFGSAPVELCIGAVPWTANPQGVEDITVADYLLRELRTRGAAAPSYADASYRRTCATVLDLEANLGSLLAHSQPRTRHTPIWNALGEVALEEVRLAVPEELAAHVAPGQILQAVSQGGHAWAYYQALLTALQEGRQAYSASQRLCITLLPAAFLQEDAPERVTQLVTDLGFSPEQLLFAVSEADLAGAGQVLRENLRRLAAEGFSFLIDTFAQGYTDMSVIISLPIGWARLHESFVKNAAYNPLDAKLLRGLVEVLTDVGIMPICPGVDTPAQRQAALAAGAVLLQGNCAER